MEFEKKPTEKQEDRFESTKSFGTSTVEEFSGLEERLGEKEKIKAISSAQIKKGDKAVVAVTNQRVIIFNSEKSKLLGKSNTFEDIRLDDILDIEIEERKDFDVLIIKTQNQERKLMTAEKKGVEISGIIRAEQKKKDEDPAHQLEKIGKEKQRGNLSEEEYEDKKDDLMDQI